MFQKSLGMAPHQYLTEVKLPRAQELLKEQSRSLIDIALSCGFSSHSYFTRIFRAQRSITPTEMRRAL
jgi:AraC family transcriptional regulator